MSNEYLTPFLEETKRVLREEKVENAKLLKECQGLKQENQTLREESSRHKKEADRVGIDLKEKQVLLEEQTIIIEQFKKKCTPNESTRNPASKVTSNGGNTFFDAPNDSAHSSTTRAIFSVHK